MSSPPELDLALFSLDRRDEYLGYLRGGTRLVFDKTAAKVAEARNWLIADGLADDFEVQTGMDFPYVNKFVIVPKNKAKAKTDLQNLRDSKLVKMLPPSPPPSRYSDTIKFRTK